MAHSVVPPALLEWLGSFAVAAVAAPAHRTSIALVAPVVSLGTWRALSPGKQRGVLAALAAVAATLLAVPEPAARALNNVIWLRVLSTAWGLSSPLQISLVTHGALLVCFLGVHVRPDASQRLFVSMTKAFLPRGFFTGGLHRQPRRELSVADTFRRAFKGLFAYNFALHVAAVVVNHGVRRLGKAQTPLKPHAFVQAAEEAMLLNMAVASSCSLWVLGAKAHSDVAGVLLAPLPLWVISSRVRNTLYFLMVPWAARLVLNVAPPVPTWAVSAVGVGALEGPLQNALQKNSYAWLVSIAFGLAQRLAGGRLLNLGE